MDNRPIGVFDSGVGGLTVARALLRELPDERLLYLGDTARVPYGPRGTETIRGFALELARFLLERDVKALVIACNSISACALAEIRRAAPAPVIDVIEPTAREAARLTRTGELAATGTAATVGSGVYTRLLAELRPEARLREIACPLFVPIAEEGLANHPVAWLMAEEYLGGLRASEVDTLLLGCTHHPLLKRAVGDVLGPRVALVDSALPTARALADLLDERELRAPERVGRPEHRFFVTDAAYNFLALANQALGEDISGAVEEVALDGLRPLPTPTGQVTI